MSSNEKKTLLPIILPKKESRQIACDDSPEGRMHALKSQFIFSSLEDSQLAPLAAHCTIRTFERGAHVFLQEEKADALYMLLAGSIKIYRLSPEGKEAVLHVCGPGEMFGEVAVFQGKSFPANAVSVEEAQVLCLPRDALTESMMKDPSIALSILAVLSMRLRGFVNKIEALTLMEIPQRLAAFLLHMQEEHNGTDRFTLHVSKALLAGMLGTARETLSRCLTRFVEQNVIAFENKDIIILDKKTLLELVSGVESL